MLILDARACDNNRRTFRIPPRRPAPEAVGFCHPSDQTTTPERPDRKSLPRQIPNYICQPSDQDTLYYASRGPSPPPETEFVSTSTQFPSIEPRHAGTVCLLPHLFFLFARPPHMVPFASRCIRSGCVSACRGRIYFWEIHHRNITLGAVRVGGRTSAR